MLQKIIYFLRGLIPGSGLIRAAIIYQMGVRKAEKLYNKTGYRFYLIWDPQCRMLRPLTYHFHTGRRDSYKLLRQHGKFIPMNEKKFCEGSFYYTPSRNGAKRMDDKSQRIQLQRLRKHMMKK